MTKFFKRQVFKRQDRKTEPTEADLILAYHDLLLARAEHITSTFNVKGMSREGRNEMKATHAKLVNLVTLRKARVVANNSKNSTSLLSETTDVMKDFTQLNTE